MLFLNLQRESKKSYAKQIYRQIKVMVLKGELQPGDRLPSTRDLAQQLSIARNTVITAYEMLVSEDYVNSIPGLGIFINNGEKISKPPEIVRDYSITDFFHFQISVRILSTIHSGIPRA